MEEIKYLNYKTQEEINWEQLHSYYLEKMKKILDEYDGWEEEDHLNADALLCELLIILGFQELIDVYSKIKKWYA